MGRWEGKQGVRQRSKEVRGCAVLLGLPYDCDLTTALENGSIISFPCKCSDFIVHNLTFQTQVKHLTLYVFLNHW